MGDELVVEIGAQDDEGVPEGLLLGISRRPPQLVLLGDGVADTGNVRLGLVGVTAADRRREEKGFPTPLGVRAIA